jgi:hypothetical protein
VLVSPCRQKILYGRKAQISSAVHQHERFLEATSIGKQTSLRQQAAYPFGLGF